MAILATLATNRGRKEYYRSDADRSMSSISNQSVRSLERNRDVKRPLRKPKKTDCHDLLLSLASSKRPVILNEGPRTLWFLGVQYELTPSQFVVAKMLVDKWYPRFVGLTESEFRGKSDKTSSTGFRNKDGAEAHSSTSQVKSCFKKSPLWGYLLVRTEKRRLTLIREQIANTNLALVLAMAKRTRIQKGFGLVVETFNATRSIMTSIDWSAILRQLLFTFGHPVLAGKVFKPMFLATFSEAQNVNIEEQIRKRPTYQLDERAKLHLTESHGYDPKRVEEQFVGRWLERIEEVDGEAGKNLARKVHRWATAPVRGSGRAYSTFTNLMRGEMFDMRYGSLVNDPTAPAQAELEAVANLVNVFTGRGTFGKTVDAGGVAAIRNRRGYGHKRLLARRACGLTSARVWKAD